MHFFYKMLNVQLSIDFAYFPEKIEIWLSTQGFKDFDCFVQRNGLEKVGIFINLWSKEVRNNKKDKHYNNI